MEVHEEALTVLLAEILEGGDKDRQHVIELLRRVLPAKGSPTAAALEALEHGGPFWHDPHLKQVVRAVLVHRLELLRTRCRIPVEKSCAPA
jgi:hypothetical protein